MSAASVETTLELWASSLRDVKARMSPLLGDVRMARSAGLFLDGLLSDERSKTGWMRLSAGEGTKGPRLHDWAYCELADLDAGEYDAARSGLWTRGLLIRRNIADGDLAFFATWCPAGTGIDTLVKVEGHRWAIEGSFETAKNELGLDHNETRSWHGWCRHVALVMLAFAMTAAIRHHANIQTPPKTKAWRARMLLKQS